MSSTTESIKKVVVGSGDAATVLIDLTDTTAQIYDVAPGKYFYGADGVRKPGASTSVDPDNIVLSTLSVTESREYDASNYPNIDGWDHVSANFTPNNQSKNVTMDTTSTSKTVRPDSGYDGLSSVSVSVSSTSKTATPSGSQQTITGGSNRYLTSVTVNAVPTETKSVTPSSSSQTVTPASGNWLSKVTVAAVPTETKSVTPSTTSQSVTPSSNKWLSKVTVAAVPTETRTVTPTESVQTVNASDNKWFKTITVDKINVAATPTVKGNTTLTAPDGQYYKEVIVDVEGTGGTDTTDATATAADILAGKSAYIASGKVDGTIPTYDKSFTGGVEITTTTVSDGTPIEIADPFDMQEALDSAEFGQVFRFVGYDSIYENGALYRVTGVKRV